MTRIFPAILTAALIWGGASLADTLDFTGLPGGNLGPSASVDGATLEGLGTSNIRNKSDQYFENAGGAVCAQKGSGDNCRGNMNIRFDSKVKKLSFFSAGHQAGDTATIVVYRGKNVVGSTGFSWNGKVNLAIYGKITRIKIEYEGVEDGMAIGRFNFTPVAAKRDRNDRTTTKPDAEVAAVAVPTGDSARAGGKSGGGKGKGNGGSGHKDR
jgi:hypothetical protein